MRQKLLLTTAELMVEGKKHRATGHKAKIHQKQNTTSSTFSGSNFPATLLNTLKGQRSDEQLSTSGVIRRNVVF